MNILAFFAHPDDETMLSGGTLALLSQIGAEVHYICATRGEGGEVGEPPLCEIDELGDSREKEMACAVQALKGRSLTFLGYTDPRVGPEDELYPFTDDLTRLSGQIAASIEHVNAHAVFTHGPNGEYGHPAHVLCHKAAVAAVLSFDEGKQPLLYSVAASFPDHPKPRLTNQDSPAHLILDTSSAIDQVLEAAMCHRTQHALFTRRESEKQRRKVKIHEVILNVEGLHRVHPESKGDLDDPVARLLRKTQS